MMGYTKKEWIYHCNLHWHAKERDWSEKLDEEF